MNKDIDRINLVTKPTTNISGDVSLTSKLRLPKTAQFLILGNKISTLKTSRFIQFVSPGKSLRRGKITPFIIFLIQLQ